MLLKYLLVFGYIIALLYNTKYWIYVVIFTPSACLVFCTYTIYKPFEYVSGVIGLVLSICIGYYFASYSLIYGLLYDATCKFKDNYTGVDGTLSYTFLCFAFGYLTVSSIYKLIGFIYNKIKN